MALKTATVVLVVVLFLSQCVIGMRRLANVKWRQTGLLSQSRSLRSSDGYRNSRLYSLSSSTPHTVEPSGGTNTAAMSASRKPRVIFVLGGPGAGKGTQCQKLSQKFGMQHLSAGELLRAERETGSANGVLIDSLIKEGKIVPVEITVDLIRQAMEASECSRFLVDGFPRNEDNVNGWEKNMRNEAVVESVIFIECAEAELEKRVVNRGLTSGRSDDNLSTVRKRFATFYDSTMPIVKYFQEMKKVVTVQGDQSKEKVFNEMSDVIIPYIQDDILGLSQRLLVATSSADWETFSTLCDPQITSLLPEHEGVSSGLMALQSRFMDEALMGKSVMLDPVVQVLGTTAIASYRREFTQGAGEVSGQCNESRVWHQVDGEWKLVHYHRSLASKVQ